MIIRRHLRLHRDGYVPLWRWDKPELASREDLCYSFWLDVAAALPEMEGEE